MCIRDSNAWVAALTFGEGWHNNHHAFPNSAKQGLFRGQIDITWEHIKFLAYPGATSTRSPSLPSDAIDSVNATCTLLAMKILNNIVNNKT